MITIVKFGPERKKKKDIGKYSFVNRAAEALTTFPPVYHILLERGLGK